MYYLIAIMLSCVAAPVDDPVACQLEKFVFSQPYATGVKCMEDKLKLDGIRGVVSVTCQRVEIPATKGPDK